MLENSIQILTAARSTKSDQIFIILEIPMPEHGRLQKRAFVGYTDQPLKEIEISDICELRDGGTILAQTSMGRIRIPSTISNFLGNVGRVPVKSLTNREKSNLEILSVENGFVITQKTNRDNKIIIHAQKDHEQDQTESLQACEQLILTLK